MAASVDPDLVSTATRLVKGHKDTTWPHVIEAYQKSGRVVAMSRVVEARHKQYLRFELYDKRDETRNSADCYKEMLSTRGIPERLTFNVHLVYDDDLSTVTLESLGVAMVDRIGTIACPDVIGSGIFTMNGDGVLACNNFYLNALSTMTVPAHRKFRYKLLCLCPGLANGVLDCVSPEFYCKSKATTVSKNA
jgi:hypothetical protein